MNAIRPTKPLKWWHVALTNGEWRTVAAPSYQSIWRTYGKETIIYTRIIKHDKNGTEIVPRETKFNTRGVCE